jgi:hypothetical protein
VQQVDRSVLVGVGQDSTSEVGGSDGTEVSTAKPGAEAIWLVVDIHHVAQALQQLDVELTRRIVGPWTLQGTKPAKLSLS